MKRTLGLVLLATVLLAQAPPPAPLMPPRPASPSGPPSMPQMPQMPPSPQQIAMQQQLIDEIDRQIYLRTKLNEQDRQLQEMSAACAKPAASEQPGK